MGTGVCPTWCSRGTSSVCLCCVTMWRPRRWLRGESPTVLRTCLYLPMPQRQLTCPDIRQSPKSRALVCQSVLSACLPRVLNHLVLSCISGSGIPWHLYPEHTVCPLSTFWGHVSHGALAAVQRGRETPRWGRAALPHWLPHPSQEGPTAPAAGSLCEYLPCRSQTCMGPSSQGTEPVGCFFLQEETCETLPCR